MPTSILALPSASLAIAYALPCLDLNTTCLALPMLFNAYALHCLDLPVLCLAYALPLPMPCLALTMPYLAYDLPIIS
jgi:hypothetical protein